MVGIGAFVAYEVYNLAALSNAGDRLKVDPVDVSVLKPKNLALLFKLNMKGANPSGTELRIDGVYIDVSLPGAGQVAMIRAGLAELGGGLKLAANTVTDFSIPFQVTLLSLALTVGSTAVSALTTGQLPKEVNVKGEIKVNGIPVAYDQRIPLKRGGGNA
jgi:hypothetical protein